MCVCVCLFENGDGKMGRPTITYDGVLTALNKHFLWIYGPVQPGSREKITLTEFRKVLIFGKITTSERKVRELWQMMDDLDFFIKINQSESRLVDLAAMAKVLGFPVTSPKKIDSESTRGTEGCLVE